MRRHNQFKVDWLNIQGVLVSNCSLQAKVHGRGSSWHFLFFCQVAMVLHKSVEAWSFWSKFEIMRLHPSETVMLRECV